MAELIAESERPVLADYALLEIVDAAGLPTPPPLLMPDHGWVIASPGRVVVSASGESGWVHLKIELWNDSPPVAGAHADRWVGEFESQSGKIRAGTITGTAPGEELEARLGGIGLFNVLIRRYEASRDGPPPTTEDIVVSFWPANPGPSPASS